MNSLFKLEWFSITQINANRADGSYKLLLMGQQYNNNYKMILNFRFNDARGFIVKGNI